MTVEKKVQKKAIAQKKNVLKSLGIIVIAGFLGLVAFVLVFVLLAFFYANKAHAVSFALLVIPFIIATTIGTAINFYLIRDITDKSLKIVEAIIFFSAITLFFVVALLSAAIINQLNYSQSYFNPDPNLITLYTKKEQTQLTAFTTLKKFYSGPAENTIGADVIYLNCYQFTSNPIDVLINVNNDYLLHAWTNLNNIQYAKDGLNAGESVTVFYKKDDHYKYKTQTEEHTFNTTIRIYKLSDAKSGSIFIVDQIFAHMPNTKNGSSLTPFPTSGLFVSAQCFTEAESKNINSDSYILEETIDHEGPHYDF